MADSTLDGLTAISLPVLGTDLLAIERGTGRLNKVAVSDLGLGMANPMTTGGDVIYGGASGAPTRLANGTVGQVLTSGGTTVAPTWSAAGAGDALKADPLSQFAATTSAQLRGVISDESGTGLAYFQGGDLGTPSAGVLTNCTFPTLNQNTSGTAAVATTVTAANEAADATAFPLFVTAATGNLGPKTNAGLTFDSTSGTLAATAFSGPLTGNVTGNASGTAATVTGATQAAITSAANLATIGTITSGTWTGTTIAIANGGTGRTTGTTAYSLIATGTAATSAQQTLANGATTEILVGGGAAALPVWTAAQGSGAPVRATSPTLTTPILGVASATSLATSAASPLLLTNGQLVTVALTSQTTGGTTLTIPDFASVADEFTFKTKAQTMSNKTFVAPALGTPASGNLSSCTADGTNAVGFLQVPQNSKSAAYTTVLADGGKHIYHPGADTTARTFTIDSNANVAYPVGTTITVVNDTSAGVVTIAITSDTLVWAGTGGTGSRQLAANGIATIIKMTSVRWMVNGTNLT